MKKQVECPHDCKRFGGRVPGYMRGSNWPWVPCLCEGTGFIEVEDEENSDV